MILPINVAVPLLSLIIVIAVGEDPTTTEKKKDEKRSDSTLARKIAYGLEYVGW